MAKKKKELTSAELLAEALVREEDWPYVVPGNWVRVRLGSVAEIVTGGTPSKKNPSFYGGDFPFIKPTNLDQGRHVLFAEEYLTEEGKKISRIIPAGSTSVCCIGSIGKCGYLDVEATTNQQINSVLPKINKHYCYYYCCTNFFKNQLNELSSATTISIVNKSKMLSTIIPLPPLAEQQRIVDRVESLFDKLDQAKDLIQEALDSFETRKTAILHQAFTGELTKKWREVNGVGIESWEDVTLGNVCQINPKRISVNGMDDSLSVTFVPMPAVSAGTGIIDEPLEKKLAEVKKGYTNFSERDIIFAKITPCMENGKSAIVGKLINNIGFGSTEFHVLRCTEKLDNHFLYHLVRSRNFRAEAKAVMKGAVGQQRVGKDFLEEYPLNLPPISEQNQIVRILDDFFEKEQNAKDLCDLIDQIEAMKKAILGKAFRGELGTNEVGEESAVTLLKSIIK